MNMPEVTLPVAMPPIPFESMNVVSLKSANLTFSLIESDNTLPDGDDTKFVPARPFTRIPFDITLYILSFLCLLCLFFLSFG